MYPHPAQQLKKKKRQDLVLKLQQGRSKEKD
jgi:hypothetical protein